MILSLEEFYLVDAAGGTGHEFFRYTLQERCCVDDAVVQLSLGRPADAGAELHDPVIL